MNTQSLIDDPTRAGRYLAGQLPEAESAAYEAHFATDPEALAELEATARLKIGLQRLRSSGELSELLAGSALAALPTAPGCWPWRPESRPRSSV